MEKQGVLARISIEIIGSPAEFVEDTLNKVVSQIKELKNIKILSSETFPAEPHEKMFSAFSELEIQFQNQKELAEFCFHFTPSRVEIISPKEFVFSMKEYEDFLNDFLAAIHDNYMITKNLQAENQILNANVISLIKNIIVLALYDFPKDIEQISKSIGINTAKLKPFLDEMQKEKRIVFKDGKYYLIKEEINKEKSDKNEFKKKG